MTTSFSMLLLLALAAGCAPPNQLDAQRYGSVVVELEARAAATPTGDATRAAVEALRVTGPAWSMRASGLGQFRVAAETLASPWCGAPSVTLRYDFANHRLTVAACDADAGHQQAAVAHGLLHMWSQAAQGVVAHVCYEHDRIPEDLCEPSVHGAATQSPCGATFAADGTLLEETCLVGTLAWPPTDADLALVDHTLGLR